VTAQEIQQLKALIVATALYYGQTIPDNVLALYVEDLADLPFLGVAAAIRDVRRDPKTTRFPLPAVIRARLMPAPSDEGEAQEAVSRLIAAVSKFGWVQPKAAREFMGELAWTVVEREGGWSNVCSELNESNIGMLRAQWRDLAESLSARSRAGTLNTPPALPKPATVIQLPQLRDIPKDGA
jgi:hypothetical protein